MRRFARLFLVLVLALDVVFVAMLVTGGTTQIFAQKPPADAELDSALEPIEAQTRWTREALQLLGRELTARAEELDARQLEVEEMMRGIEVLKRAAVEEKAAPGAASVAGTNPSTAPRLRQAPDTGGRQELFTRLQKTYENMEPESAAAALSQLAVLDKGAVIELILGWKPRVSGAVLDALTLSDPALAADLSYGIWLRSGKNQPEVGSAP